MSHTMYEALHNQVPPVLPLVSREPGSRSSILRVSSLSRYPMVTTLFPTMICTGPNRDLVLRPLEIIIQVKNTQKTCLETPRYCCMSGSPTYVLGARNGRQKLVKNLPGIQPLCESKKGSLLPYLLGSDNLSVNRGKTSTLLMLVKGESQC